MSRSKKSRQNHQQRLIRLRQKRLGQQTAIREIAVRSAGRVKMSEVIEHLAEPLLDELGDTPEDVEQIIRMTIVAWNVTLFPPQDREKRLQALVEKMFRGREYELPLIRRLCDLVAERKRKYYPTLRHFIIDVRFEREPGDTVYFEVAYTLEEATTP